MGVETRTQSVRRDVVIEARPETVWELLTDPKQAVRWMGIDARFELRPGGEYRVEVIPDHVAVGKFVEIDPPRRLVYTFGWESGSGTVPPGSTTIEFELEKHARGTLLHFTHRDLPTADAAEKHTLGWEHYLARLEAVARGGDPGQDPWVSGPMK